MNPTPLVDERKARLRKHATARRAQLVSEYDASLTRPDKVLARFADSLIDQFAPTILAGYWPFRSEIDILPLLSALQEKGVRLCLPITGPAGTPLSFHYWSFGSELDTGRFGIKQPFQGSEQLFPDVICVPLLAFDSSFQRLGYGGGYYDRTLAGLRSQGHKVAAVGLAHAGQQTDSLVTGPYDEPLDAVLTPEGWLVRP
jgi:5-formyltetrahydrofolate cyclo-ligase